MKKDAEIIGLWGGRGSGKTTWMRENLEKKNRVIVLDPMDDIKLKGFKRVRSLQAVYKLIKQQWNTGFKIILVTGHSDAKCQGIMVELNRALFQIMQPYKQSKKGMAGKEITLAIDEAHKFIPNPPHGDLIEPLNDLIALGRHYGVEIIGASQRIVKVWTEFRGNAMHHYFFRQGDHNDIDTISSMIGRQNKEKLLNLQTHHYLHLNKLQGLNVIQGKNKADFR